MKKMLLSMLAAAVCLGAAGLARAQNELKPVATFSFSGVERMMHNVGAIARLGGQPDLEQKLGLLLQMAAQGDGLAGLDAKLPWGAMLLTDGQKVVSYGFLPLANLKQAVDMVQSFPTLAGQVKVELNNGVYDISVPTGHVFARQRDKWTVLAGSSQDLAHAPADPLRLFGNLPKDYDIACHVSVKDIPKPLLEQMLVGLQSGAQASMKQLPDETDDIYELRTNVTKQAVQWVVAMIGQLDDLTLGWKLDAGTDKMYLDLAITAQPGTNLARRLAEMKPGRTVFGGFALPDAAMTVQWVGRASIAGADQKKANADMLHQAIVEALAKAGFSGDQDKLSAQLADHLTQVLQNAAEAKHRDGGLALVLKPAAVTLVAGLAVADDDKLAADVERLADDLQATKLGTLRSETEKDVHFHTLSIPVPDPKLAKMVGDSFEVVLAAAKGKFAVAIGHDGVGTLKKALHPSRTYARKQVPPLAIALSASKIAKFVAEVAEDEQVEARATALAEALQKAGSDDHVLITAGPIPRGMRLRLELEDGLLKALATMCVSRPLFRAGPPMQMQRSGGPPPQRSGRAP